MRGFLKYWKWILIGIVLVGIYFFYESWISGRIQKAVSDLRQDQSKVIADKEAYVRSCEKEISDLYGQIQINREIIRNLQSQRNSLQGQIDAVESRRQNIIVSSNPDDLVLELRKLGFSSVERIRK
jgi:peptidoglycan hydrolase CwlO-like protein